MTLRSLAHGSLLYSIGFVLPRIGTFLLLPIYVSVLSAADFGAIAIVVSVAQMAATILRMGFDGALLRMHFDSADPARQDRLLATIATLTSVVAAAGALLVAGVALVAFERIFVGLDFAPYGATAAVLSFSVTFQYLPATVFRAREQPWRLLAFTGGAFVVTAVTTVVLLVVVRMGVVGALIGQLAGGAFVVVVSLAMVARARGPGIDRPLAREALRFGLPLVPHTLAGWVLNVSDRWLLSFLLPLSAASARATIGVYSLGYQLAYAIDLLAQSFNAAWVPFFYRYGSSRAGPRIHREMTTIVMAGFAALAAAVAIHAELIVTLIAAPAFAGAADLIPLLTLAFLAHVLYIAVVTVVFHQRRTGVLPFVTGASAIVNVATNIVLIPVIGVWGAAWATVAAFGSMALATAVAAARVYPLALDVPRLTVAWAIAIGAVVVASSEREPLSITRITVDLGVTAIAAVAAALLAFQPARSLRAATRSASLEERARLEPADRAQPPAAHDSVDA